MRVKWLRTALANLNAEADYIAQDSPEAASRVVTAIEDAVNNLAQFPAMGRAGRVTGTRELVVPGTPYIIPYRVRNGAVEILRVFHGARRWPKQL
ncbi:MAG TPA: type II toxin-antitoxin system RelE/ParE family toxin [Terriglobales bacterium]|nr:type II toxin-antitoxin system RelE/ParE family toxin [Terriglobales bacterium]